MHVSKENVACKKPLQNFKSMSKPQGTPWAMLKNVGVSSEYLREHAATNLNICWLSEVNFFYAWKQPTLNYLPTLVTLIVVQDILIIF